MAEESKDEQFTRLFSEVEPRLYGFLFTLHPDREDADDIMQEAMVVLWSRFDQYDPERPFFRWACSFVYHKALEFRRRKHRDKRFFNQAVFELLASDLDQRPEEKEDKSAALSACISKLTKGEKTLLDLRYYTDCSLEEVATRTGTTSNALSKRLQRIRIKLTECVRLTLEAKNG